MANAKLWWNGSSWDSSEAFWLNGSTGISSSYSWVYYKIKITAYDDGTLLLEATVTPSHGDAAFSGSKVIEVDGETAFTLTNQNRSASALLSSPVSTIDYSGTLAVRRQITGQPYGAPWQSSGETTITNPFRTITFNANGGADAPSPWTTTDGTVTIPDTVPARTGYTFLGWSTDQYAVTASYTAGGTANLSGDVTLYAVWKANSYGLTITKPATAAITILRNGTAYSGNTVNHDDVLTITATPSPGYRITSLKVNGSDFVSGSTHSVSGAVAIVADTVAQSSTIATYDGSVQTLQTFSLTANRYSTSHYNKLRYYDSNDTLLDTSDVFTDSTSLVIPKRWFSNFGSDASIIIKAELTTYTEPECINETGVKDSCFFTVTADDSMRPELADGCVTLTAYNTDTGAARLTNPGFVKGYSKVQAVFDTSKITHAIGASAASTGAYAIEVQGVETSGSGTTVLSSNKLNASGTAIAVKYTVTDSRGRKASGTETISVSDYAGPAISSLNCFRCNSAQQPDDDEPYMAVTASCTFTQIADNAITIGVEVKPTGGSYTSYGPLTNATQARIGGSFLADTSYFVKVTVTDSLLNSAYTELSMPRRSWDFHIRHSLGGAGAAFGKVTEHDMTLQLASGWEFMMGSTSMTEAGLIYLLGLNSLIGNTALPTIAQTITGAIAEIAGGGGGGGITDVEVDGVSVVTGGVADIDLTGKSDVGHTHVSADITDLSVGLSMKLLWTNPSPSSNFAAQTLSLDLSGYDAVAIVSRQAGNTDRVSWDFALIGETIVTQVKNMSSATIYGRSAEVTSSGIVFGNGYAGSTAGATNAIPVKIYGIKGIT